jgi:hypothetical protein
VQAFGALLDLEVHLGAFIQGAVSVALNGRKMHEDIFSILALDKPVAIGSVEPLRGTFFPILKASSLIVLAI